MYKNRAKAILKEGGAILGTCVTDYVGTEVVPTIKAAGLDFFFIDTEHSAASYRDVQNLVRAAKAMDITAIVRVTQTEGHLISRALDCGAMGIVAPRVHSVEQAQSVVDSMKFPPMGGARLRPPEHYSRLRFRRRRGRDAIVRRRNDGGLTNGK